MAEWFKYGDSTCKVKCRLLIRSIRRRLGDQYPYNLWVEREMIEKKLIIKIIIFDEYINVNG